MHDAEDSREHFVRRRPLQEREPRHVLDDVGDPDQREGDERDRGRGVRRDEDHRSARAGDGDPEHPREPAPPDEHQREHGSDQPPDPDCRIEVADAAGPDVQQLEGGDRDQHAHRAVDERLSREEADHELEAPVASDRAEALDGFVHDRPWLADQRRLVGLQQRGQQQRRPDERPGGGREDDPGVRDREEDAADRRAGAEAEALERARADVGGGQLLGRSRERGEQGSLRGLEGS